MESFLGALHPNGSLFEDFIDIRKAQAEHRGLVESLRKKGIEVVQVREILKIDCDENLGERLKVEKLAMQSMKYMLDPSQDRKPI
jgi:arginine deiminase